VHRAEDEAAIAKSRLVKRSPKTLQHCVIARSPSALLRINSATKQSHCNLNVLEIASLRSQ
jgi:hypothetical protein